MTDRLSTLLHDEVAALPVPTPPADRVLAEGRTIRGRRRARTAVTAAVAAVAVVAAGIAITTSGSDGELEPAKLPDQEAYQQLGAWARGDEVHVGNRIVTVPGTQELQYTSVGVVVSTQDGTRVLVGPDGETRRLDLDLHDTGANPFTDVVATDATAPYLAYVRVLAGDLGQLTVRDLTTDQETTVGEPFDTRGQGLVRSLWGDQVYYVHRHDSGLVNWRTGADVAYPRSHGVFVFLDGGLGHGVTFGVDDETREWVVGSRTDDTTLLRVPVGEEYSGTATVSPDGRYLATSTDGSGIDIHVLATGATAHVDGERFPWSYGWTPDGHLVGRSKYAKGAEVEVCAPTTGECQGTGTVTAGDLTLVGRGQLSGL